MDSREVFSPAPPAIFRRNSIHHLNANRKERLARQWTVFSSKKDALTAPKASMLAAPRAVKEYAGCQKFLGPAPLAAPAWPEPFHLLPPEFAVSLPLMQQTRLRWGVETPYG